MSRIDVIAPVNKTLAALLQTAEDHLGTNILAHRLTDQLQRADQLSQALSSADARALVDKTLAELLQTEGDLGANILARRLTDLLLRIDQLNAITGLSTPSIYRKIAEGTFPRPYNLTSSKHGAKAWRLSEIIAWMDGLKRSEEDQP